MSFRIYPNPVNWERFVAANEQATETLELLPDLTGDETDSPPELYGEPFSLAEEVGEYYEAARGVLPDDQRELWDLFLYAAWWMPNNEIRKEVPALANIITAAVEVKGEYGDLAIRVLSPETVAHVAEIWRRIDLSVLQEAMETTFEDYWPDNFESAESVCRYLSSWGEIFISAAENGLALVIALN